MNPRPQAGLYRALNIVGTVSIAFGFATELYSCFVLRPKIGALTRESVSAIKDAGEAAESLNRNIYFLADSLRGVEDGGKLLAVLPETFKRLRDVLHLGSQASASTGGAAKESQKGVAGLVLPKDELKASGAALQGTARQMGQLAKSVGKLEGASAELADDATKLSKRASELAPQLDTQTDAIVRLRERLRSAEQAIEYSDLPAQAMLTGITLGGLYLVIGILALLLARTFAHADPV